MTDSNEERLIAAAIRCIETYGISKTFIDDIAREAGLSRPTAYRAFGSRKALLERVAAYSANRFKDVVKAKLRKHSSFADVMVLGSTESLRLARKDKVFMALLNALGDEGLERYLLDPDGPVFAYTLEAWKESFGKARDSGEVYADISDEELTALICAANCYFLLRNGLNRKQQVAFLSRFLLPAIIPGYRCPQP